MSKEIKLPSGATVKLKDPAQLRVKDRKNVMKTADSTEGGDLSKAFALSDALIACIIESWSFEFEIPSVKKDALDELTTEDYDFLVEQTKAAQKALFPSIAETPENETDPKAITANSNA